MPRTSDTFLQLGDKTMTYLLPPNERPGNEILPIDRICKPSQQSSAETVGSPRLEASAGAQVLLRYQENGHVTLPANTPGKLTAGMVSIYGTNQSLPDDTLQAIHNVWNAMGTGGDQQGRLLAQQNFDDGACYQPNGGRISRERRVKYPPDPLQGQNRWCRNHVQLPQDTTEGLYTLYWVWDWPTSSGTPGALKGKREIYTTCIDVDIVET